MRQPKQTRLVAEALPRGAMERAQAAHGEYWMDHCECEYRTFSDTEAGLRSALAWCHRVDVFGGGRIARERLRDDWHIYKPEYWYDDSGEWCCAADGQWVHPSCDE